MAGRRRQAAGDRRQEGRASQIARAIEAALSSHANPERSAFLSGGYTPSRLRILGVAVPAMRRIVRQFSRELDGFATSITGRAWRDGRLADRDVVRWAQSRDRWWRRTALVSTVPLNVRSRGGTGDARRTLLVATHIAGDGDPMIAKALSWALRSLVPHDPRAVRSFLARERGRLPALVRREVEHKLATGLKAPRRTGPAKRP